MSLKSDAIELSAVLNDVLRGLLEYKADTRAAYTQAAAKQLAPLVREFDHAVRETRSRLQAADVLASIKTEMQSISAAHTKGEIEFVSGSTLDRYWHLNTIFQESRYRDQSL